MKAARKLPVPRLKGAALWGGIAGVLALGLLTTVIDFIALPKTETARATKQKQRFVVNATSGEVLLGDATATPAPAPEVTPARVPEPAEPPPSEPVEPPAEDTDAPAPATTPEAATPAPEAIPPKETPAASIAPAPETAAPAPEALAPPTPVAADPALPKNTPSLRITPISEALKDQPRTNDSLVSAPAPEITEIVDGIKVPKRGDKDVVASKLYAHPFKREADQILISFVILNTGLDPQSIGLAMALPPEVTVAYSPYTKPSMAYSENLRTVGHEVWTMLPAMGEHYPSDDPGPLGIIGRMPAEETSRRVREVMGAIPGAVGLILPPDETIMQQKTTMDAALSEISSRGLLLMTTNPNHNIDQITTNAGLAAIIHRADLVLDPTPNESQIRSRLAGLLDAARDKGEFVVALSARPQSLQILNDWLQQTKLAEPFVLAPLSAIYQPREKPEVEAPTADAGGHSESKPKPPPKKKPKVLPQDQYKQPAEGEKKSGGH